MNKTQAISRISQAKETDEIVVATFPCNICQVCHQRKQVLFVKFVADTIQECCGTCSIKLDRLEEVLEDLLPEQMQEYIRQMM